jgi:hypothetical protein
MFLMELRVVLDVVAIEDDVLVELYQLVATAIFGPGTFLQRVDGRPGRANRL